MEKDWLEKKTLDMQRESERVKDKMIMENIQPSEKWEEEKELIEHFKKLTPSEDSHFTKSMKTLRAIIAFPLFLLAIILGLIAAWLLIEEY